MACGQQEPGTGPSGRIAPARRGVPPDRSTSTSTPTHLNVSAKDLGTARSSISPSPPPPTCPKEDIEKASRSGSSYAAEDAKMKEAVRPEQRRSDVYQAEKFLSENGTRSRRTRRPRCSRCRGLKEPSRRGHRRHQRLPTSCARPFLPSARRCTAGRRPPGRPQHGRSGRPGR